MGNPLISKSMIMTDEMKAMLLDTINPRYSYSTSELWANTEVPAVQFFSKVQSRVLFLDSCHTPPGGFIAVWYVNVAIKVATIMSAPVLSFIQSRLYCNSLLHLLQQLVFAFVDDDDERCTRWR